MERLVAGDKTAIEELLQEHLSGLRGYVRLRAGPELRAMESASDIVQSVCREILENRERFQFNGEEGFRKWLYTTALRKLSNRARQRRTLKRGAPVRALEDVPDGEVAGGLLDCYRTFCTPSRAAQATEEVGRIEAAFDELPDEYREVITLSRILGFSHTEIAARMGRSEGATRTLLYRALGRLSGLLDLT